MALIAHLKSQPPHYENRVTAYPQFYLIAVRKGRLFYEDAASQVVIRPGMAAVLRKGSDFRLHTQKEGYESVAVEVRPPEQKDLAGPSGVIAASTLVSTLIEGMQAELTRPGARSSSIIQGLASAAVELSLDILMRKSGSSAPEATPAYWAGQLQAAIHGALHTDLRIEDIASGSELSYRQLSRHFLAVYGISPKAYQLQKKIQEARQLLGITDFSATQIAAELGFPSSQHFSAQFKKVTGKVPGYFRSRKH